MKKENQYKKYSIRLWSDNERKILLEMFCDNYTTTICKMLNRSYGSVSSQSRLMGLKKSDSFMKMELQKQADRLKIVGVANQYKKGRDPENKGKPMSKELYDKCKPTMFKKGNNPHNTKYDGHERISKDGYVEVRIRKGKYDLKHRLVWKELNGDIPKGFIVVFKDKNKTNIVIENLELISFEENMKRNTIQRYPGELKSTIRLINKLKRTINAKEQN
jgi:hypothetical protein